MQVVCVCVRIHRRDEMREGHLETFSNALTRSVFHPSLT